MNTRRRRDGYTADGPGAGGLESVGDMTVTVRKESR